MHQKQSGLKLKLRSTLVNNDEKKMAIGERIIHEKTYFEPQMTLNQHGIAEFTFDLLRKQFKSFTEIETIMPGNSSDITVVSGHYSGHFHSINMKRTRNSPSNQAILGLRSPGIVNYTYVYQFLFRDRIYYLVIRKSIGSVRHSQSL